MSMNAFHEEAIADHEIKEYQNTLQDYIRSFQPDLTICKSWNMFCIPCKSIQLPWLWWPSSLLTICHKLVCVWNWPKCTKM